MKSKPILAVLFSTLAVLAASCAAPGTAVAGEIFVDNYSDSLVGEYTTSGATINASLFAAPGGATGMTVSGADIFMCGSGGHGTSVVAEYTTSGATVNASLISIETISEGAPGPIGQVALSGGDIFITERNGDYPYGGTVAEYTTSGALVNSALIGPLSDIGAVAVSGSDLFVSSYTNVGTIGEYTTSGETVDASLITGLSGSGGFALSGDDLFFANAATGTISEYTTSGVLVNASLVAGLDTPDTIAVVPEPSSLLLLLVGAAGLGLAAAKRIAAATCAR